MKTKKTPKANLEKKKSIFLQIGLVIVLSLTYMAFEWKIEENFENTLGQLIGEQIDEEDMANTFPESKPTPPPPVVLEVLDIVEDDVDIEDELIIEDTDIDEDTDIKIVEVDVDDDDEEEIFNFYVLEDKPEFPFWGELGLLKWIADNTKYPESPREMGITGRILVQFVIEKDGSVSNVKVLRKVDPYLDKEAVRVIKSMPKWKPGKQRGKPVKVSFQVPINFTISG